MDTKAKLKQILAKEMDLQKLTSDGFDDDSALFGDSGLGLDSLDAVELVIVIKKHFAIDVKDMKESKAIFTSVNTLAAYIDQHLPK
jgi:acyl carrier protein